MLGSGLNLSLSIGYMVPAPAPAALMEALESVEITTSDESPDGFQLHFHADRKAGLTSDFALLSQQLLVAGNRVLITVTLEGSSTVLMDGLITNLELSYTRAGGASALTVTGEDVSVAMDLVELSMEYPMMPDSLIAEAVLIKYAPFGVLPEVVPTLSSSATLPLDGVPQQNTTDRKYLQQLAAAHGNVFFVKPGPAPLMNTAYWGPPVRFGVPQKALSIDLGPATNVESLQFQYTPLNTETVYGMVQDTELEIDLPVVTLLSTRTPPLAAAPALGANLVFQRRSLFTDPRLGILDAMIQAQMTTDRSTDRVVVGQGELDVLRYGAILTAPGMVAVRGAGQSFDGLYAVQSVSHKLSRGSYRQSFTLSREGLGTTIPAVVP